MKVFNYSVPDSQYTSAGVFLPDKTTKVAEVWGNEWREAGAYTFKWDGLTDEKYKAYNGNYIFMVQLNGHIAEQALWSARFGNTSTDEFGIERHRSYNPPYDVVIKDNTAFYCTKFNEGTTSMFRFELNDYQRAKRVDPRKGRCLGADHVCTDGERVYWAGEDSHASNTPTMVVATDFLTDAFVTFSAGVDYTMATGINYPSVIAKDDTYRVTGMAVYGNYLYLCYGLANEIRVIYKPSGAFVSSFPVTNPRTLRIVAGIAYLKHTDNQTIEKFTVNGSEPFVSTGLTFTGIVNGLSFGVSSDGSKLSITDRNNGNELIRHYNTTTGEQIGTIGGRKMIDDPEVTNDAFYFKDTSTVAYQADGSFWVVDGGNNRLMKFASDSTYSDYIMWLSTSYSASADKNDATRQFWSFQEFSIDLTESETESENAWTYVANYEPSLKHYYPDYTDEKYGRFRSCVTIQGHTYAIFKIDTSTGVSSVFEIFKNAPIRKSFDLPADSSCNIREDGALIRDTGIVCYIRPLLSIDGNGDMVHGVETVLYNLGQQTVWSPVAPNNRAGKPTTSGAYQVWRPSGAHNGFHLGLARGNSLVAQTAKSTNEEYIGEYPTDGSFDIGNYVKDAGTAGLCMVVGNFIYWLYFGEFWSNSQSCYWHIVSDKGLTVAIIGTDGKKVSGTAEYGMAGNARSGAVVEYNGKVYMLNCDESQFGALHQRIIPAPTVTYLEYPFTINETTTGVRALEFIGDDFDNVKLNSVSVVNNINVTNMPPFNCYAFEGYIKPLYSQPYRIYVQSDAFVRLWLTTSPIQEFAPDINQPLNDGLNEYSFEVSLEAGKQYPIRVEANGSTVIVRWSSASQTKQIIPQSAYSPAPVRDYSKGIPLFERLDLFRDVDNLYGVQRSPATNIPGFTAALYRESHNTPDITLQHKLPLNTIGFINRNLPDVDDSTLEWELSGKVLFDPVYPNWGDQGISLQVLDQNYRPILKLFMLRETPANSFYINTTRAYQGDLKNVAEWQKLIITGKNGQVEVDYAPFGKFTVNPLSSLALWNKPKTLQIYCNTGDRSEVKRLSLDSFVAKFSGEVEPEIPEGTPIIDSFTPVLAPSGGTITITGSNFVNVTSVKFGGVEAASFIVISPTSISAVVAGGATGNISVTNNVFTGTKPGFLHDRPIQEGDIYLIGYRLP